MDDLRTTLATFSPEDRKEFVRFIQRQKRKSKGRMDVQLCELLLHTREYTTPQLLSKLYPDEPNPTAYYALRKRLLRHITDYLLLRQHQQDPTTASSVRGLLTLAQYLFEAGIPRLAWSMLHKAEKLARTNEQFELLNTVYNLQIAQAGSEYADELEDIIRRRHLNKKAADEEERAGIADSLIRQRLRQARVKGRAGEAFDGILQDVLREYDLQEAFARRPSVLYRLMSIARSAMLVRRDFVSFAPFVQRCYHIMEKRHGFQPAHRYYQLGLLYMVAHAQYRTRRFQESVQYLGQLRAVLSEAGAQGYHNEWLPRYTFLLAANYAFLRRNAESIQLLEQVLRQTSTSLSTRDLLTARLGLAFHYFAEGQFHKTNQTLIGIGRSDHWCEQEMGLEWTLNKNMGEMLVQFELGNPDLALNRLRAIERVLRERFTADGGGYAAILGYLGLVREIMDDPAAAQRPGFAERVRQLPAFAPLEQEDLQALSFYGWLHARMKGRPYYEVLLELSGGAAAVA
ncbi:hypothetical protein KBK19_03570 [Microvirga sp. STR05]|uniref:Tetratricopeptide repeat protein n=1 Tax=Hymenobacter duratus TaxID=2771356 RepID=A0ABR8JBL3_9BACT|nr:hypothetical protein [Hymenobacter duratus]MBD2714109.1 hypothetical protein [Hymenobacter duratus]MBR7949011.1 hypothetical protein [Microvirga sp. STR05]